MEVGWALICQVDGVGRRWRGAKECDGVSMRVGMACEREREDDAGMRVRMRRVA